MLSLPFNSNVNFQKLVSQEASFKTSIDKSFMPRLVETCHEVLSPIEADFKFYEDLQGMNTIEGSLKVRVSFVCQRCSKVFEKQIEASFKSTCDEQKAKSLQIEDKVDIVPLEEDGSFELLSYLEDCLLLEIPYITTHEEGNSECVENQDWEFGKIEKSKEDNPFAQLSALKDKLKSQN